MGAESQQRAGVTKHFYVLKDDETLQTSNRFEAARIAAEWIRRGYDVDTVVIEVTADAVREAA
jgi:hypothetical protein